ncbi:hypothetical protein MKX01_018383 [Papaver californicum]|nr:hypothetical protein MKX01_018383 [Papaver californicum]
MVLGLRTKHKKGTSVQVDYQIHIQEIKPWPPSQSLKSVRFVILQWENGDRNSGSINPVVPSVGSGVGDGKIEFNESFRLTLMLSTDASVKGRNAETYMKNCIEFNLYEPRRDKTVKGQLLGTVVIDLAEYGPIRETIIVSAPMNCKRSFKNTAQPVLSIKIQPFEKHISSSSSRESLYREASLDMDAKESVSALMNEEYAEEAEIASFSDDDVSSQSSITNSSSAFEATGSSSPQNEENALESVKDDKGTSTCETRLPLEQVAVMSGAEPVIAAGKHLNGSSSPSPSIELSSEVESPGNDQASMPNFHNRNPTSIIRKNVNHCDLSSSSSLANEGIKEDNMNNSEPMSPALEVRDRIFNGRSNIQVKAQPMDENDIENILPEAAAPDTNHQVVDSHQVIGKKQGENDQRLPADKEGYDTAQNETSNGFSPDATRPSGISTSDTPPFSSSRGLRVNGNTPTTTRLRYAKSVRSPLDSPKGNGFLGDNQSTGEVKVREGTLSFTGDEGKDATVVPKEVKNNSSDSIIQQLKHRIKKLQGELRETAAMELSLYSVVAEHRSSANKVHAPARRLSRLYLHASKNPLQVSRASVAKSIVSGLLLVAKACGNDVPRLTFWLSNSVVLRGIISLTLEDSQLPVSAGPHVETNDAVSGNTNRSSSLKWKKSPSIKKESNLGSSDDWEDLCTFTTALEKIETWIFSRIVESIWWQTLTPYMQPAPGKSCERRMSSSIRGRYERQSSLCAQEQVNFSLDLWKKAFKDARERLCPVRASGHECGCLPLLARLVMEQSVARLDVAMFNAILRESVDEIPMDPVSDPISDSDVLPIPAGKSSFGAGAQLKNAIGNWSRWLSDLFGLDDDDHHHDEDESDFDSREESEKSFRLLNAFSNLMMLPKDMLMDRAIRREVCPTFDAPMIRRILQNFVADEFCPEPVPNDVFDTINAECQELIESDEFIENFPLNATPITYQPPSADSLVDIIGEVGKETQLRRSGLSVVRKAYTSDDELDELDSPVNSIIFENPQSSSAQRWMTTRQYGIQQVSRYQLLREVWKEAD